MSIHPNLADRLSMRESPVGSPIMYQSWGNLLFMHWQMPSQILRPLVPNRLSLDSFDGQTWVGLIPFTIWDSRIIFTPAVPWLSTFHEINVRTYVYLDGVPGVWFFSLDADSVLAVRGARRFFHLPYQKAHIMLQQRGNTIHYVSQREQGLSADFEATWIIGRRLPQAEPGSLDFFLTERYCLFTSYEEKLYRCHIHHEPWPLYSASLSEYRSTLMEANGLPSPELEPLLRCGGPVHVQIWPLEEIRQ
jgi:uncharacterized protein YqjF (DUF2071 family)